MQTINSLAWTGWSDTFPVRQVKHKESVAVSQTVHMLFLRVWTCYQHLYWLRRERITLLRLWVPGQPSVVSGTLWQAAEEPSTAPGLQELIFTSQHFSHPEFMVCFLPICCKLSKLKRNDLKKRDKCDHIYHKWEQMQEKLFFKKSGKAHNYHKSRQFH